MQPQPDDLKLPDDESAPSGTPVKERPVVTAIFGFVAAPVILGATAAFNSPLPPMLFLVSAVVMLFFRGWRAFGLGVLLFTGVAFLLLLAICGNSNF